MRRRKTTITEEYGPSFRRRLPTHFMHISLPGLHEEPDSEEEDHSNPPESPLKSSIGSNHMKKVTENLEGMAVSHEKIHRIIDEVDEIIRGRMEAHEMELIEVVRKEIDSITQDSRKVVQAYNQMIEEKNKETEIHSLQNQLSYFQAQAKQLFYENSTLIEENRQLRTLLQTKDSILQETNLALKKSTKKYLRQRYLTEPKAQQDVPDTLKNFHISVRKQTYKAPPQTLSARVVQSDHPSKQETLRKSIQTRKSAEGARDTCTRKKNYPSMCFVDLTDTPQLNKMLEKQKNITGSITHRCRKTTNKPSLPTAERRLRTETDLSLFEEPSNLETSKGDMEQKEKNLKERSKAKSFWRFQGVPR